MLGENGAWFPTRLSFAHFAQPTDGIPANFNAAFYEATAQYGFAPWWFVAGWAEIRNAIAAELDPLWSGDKTAAEAAAEMQRVGDPLIKQAAHDVRIAVNKPIESRPAAGYPRRRPRQIVRLGMLCPQPKMYR